jgi:hypothetical protein
MLNARADPRRGSTDLDPAVDPGLVDLNRVEILGGYGCR